MDWPEVVFGLYLIVLGVLSLNGLHRLWMLWAWARGAPSPDVPDPAEWPRVTVQLPVFNERYVVRRLVEACGALDYPANRLHIQVLDDSTDDTTERAREAVQALVDGGVDAVLIHRDDRTGFKAGALAAGLKRVRGDIVAIFDADFVPPPDFLRRTVPHLVGPIGMVQARWGHLNAGDSWLTTAQATLLDGHFVIEHTARHRSGRWFNFNGTAGIWRRACIEEAGGWQHDTITEDLDLSYRAQLAGWEFRYLPEVVAPAELPATMAAFKTQQHRWAKGSIQTARKLLGTIWRSDAPLARKLEATVHLTANLSYPLVVLLSVLLPWAVWARVTGGPSVLLKVDLLLFLCAVLPFVAFYAAAIVGAGADDTRTRLVRLPLVLALGLGMALSQSRAVFSGVFAAPGGTFVRTPKRGSAAVSVYRSTRRAFVPPELALALYLSVASLFVLAEGYVASLPFLALFTGGYGAVAYGTLRDRRASGIASATPAGGQVIHHNHGASAQARVVGS